MQTVVTERLARLLVLIGSLTLAFSLLTIGILPMMLVG